MTEARFESEISGEEFLIFLQDELAKRCRQNRRYSLRAFARSLGIDHSRLSKILRGKRPVSQELIMEVAARLDMSIEKLYGFISKTRQRNDPDYLLVSKDAHELLEDPVNYRLLESMKLKSFNTDPNWLSKHLKVSKPVIYSTIERLQRIGLLKIHEDGTWTDLSKGFASDIVSEAETSVVRRRAQKQLLEEAKNAIDEFDLDERDQSSIMMATSQSKLLEAKAKIKRFRRELCSFLEGVENKDAVFQLTISLYPTVQVQNLINPGILGVRNEN